MMTTSRSNSKPSPTTTDPDQVSVVTLPVPMLVPVIDNCDADLALSTMYVDWLEALLRNGTVQVPPNTSAMNTM